MDILHYLMKENAKQFHARQFRILAQLSLIFRVVGQVGRHHRLALFLLTIVCTLQTKIVARFQIMRPIDLFAKNKVIISLHLNDNFKSSKIFDTHYILVYNFQIIMKFQKMVMQNLVRMEFLTYFGQVFGLQYAVITSGIIIMEPKLFVKKQV